MASKAMKTIAAEVMAGKQFLWEKYNKPTRNLYQALSAFEAHGVGQKVVVSQFEAIRSLIFGHPSDDMCLVAVQVGGKGIQGLLLYRHCAQTSSIAPFAGLCF
jgi:hypothetical protein